MSIEMYCTTKTLKYVLHIFNLLLIILGILLILFGFWLLNSIVEENIDHGENLGAVVTILMGFVVIGIAVFGFIATYLESRQFLICYAVVLVILLVLQFILVSVSYFAGSAGFAENLKRGFEELWERQDQMGVEPNSESTLAYYEQWLQCCGRNSAEDYLLADKFPPKSCCKNENCENVLNLFVIGCESKFKDYMYEKSKNFNILSWFLIVAEFSGSVLTCVFIDSIKNHRDRVRFYS